MRNIWFLYKKELKSYFTSPIAYAAIFIFGLLSGYFFNAQMAYYTLISLQAGQSPMSAGLNAVDLVISPFFGSANIIILLMLPVVTMRLLSEEKKSGTTELLFSYPIRDGEVVLGKYFSALTVFGVMILLTFIYHALMAALGVAEFGVAFSGTLGLFLSGASFIAIGLFVSSMTENQIVAAVVTFGLLLLVWVIGWSASLMSSPWKEVFDFIALLKHQMNFARGLIDTADVVYYLCFVFFFLFLTLRSLESKRWRG